MIYKYYGSTKKLHGGHPETKLKEVFMKSKASGLLQHRSYDCSKELLPGNVSPCNRIYLLSLVEQKVMEDYV